MKNILSYFGIKTLSLSGEQMEWDKKLKDLWYKEYMMYCRYRVTSDKEQHQRAKDAWDHLMRYPNMFHDETVGRYLLDDFWKKENPYPIYIPTENKYNISKIRKDSHVGARVVNLEEYRRYKKNAT